MPWRTDAHDAVLTRLLGPRPLGDAQPARLAALALRINEAFGNAPGRGFNPHSQAQVLRALRHAGIQAGSTRAWELRGIDHPAAPLLLEFKELARLHTAHGWAWQDAWVRGGRFRPGYVVGGVVSGRWATRGGGALQIPGILRRAVVADEGWSLVVADAGQLEPRVLAALSGDPDLIRAAAAGDIYAALAAEAFDGDRAAAKLALLGAMYGQTSGGIGPLLAVLRRRFPAAMAYLRDAALAGERGLVVSSRLGRACPPPSRRRLDTVLGLDGEGGAPDGGGGGQAARARGRFTRNFVIQAGAADWALVWIATLRGALAALAAEHPALPPPALVFFVHDEVVVHAPAPLAARAAAAVERAAHEARRLVFGATAVRFPLAAAVVDCYADAK